MKLETYYNNIIIRLFSLITLSLILSGFYLKYLNNTDDKVFLKQEKFIYLLQLSFWFLFLSNFFEMIFPPNIISSFSFELIILTIIVISFVFLVWKLFNKQKFSFGIFIISLPLILLFILALGMD